MKIRIAFTLALALVVCTSGYSQKKSNKKVIVTGKVINQDEVPISNVMIFLDGKNSNVVTNSEGEFKIKIKPPVEKIAFFNFLDGAFELDYEGQTELSIIVQKDFVLETLKVSEGGNVVETGYGTIRRDELTGSISSIDKNKFDYAIYTDIYAMIEGEVPGVTVSGKSIVIRGATSINGSNQPLFVVDGSPSFSIDHIPPSDVASIDILKGGATAIYGTRGAAGVIVIKLKSAKR